MAGNESGNDSSNIMKERRKRTSKPKVRTGCATCKKRHVKCDEQRPTCRRCEDMRIPCAGYIDTTVAKDRGNQRTGESSKRLILPRLEQHSSSVAPITKSLSVYNFEMSDEDGIYFQLFRHHLARELSPFLESQFWGRIALRESMEHPCIRHSLLSIAAYRRAMPPCRAGSGSQFVSTRPSIGDLWTTFHHKAAIRHHAKAIRLLNENIGADDVSIRTVLITTLLLIAFENIQGNFVAAENLVLNGIRVLNQRTHGQLVQDEEVHEMERMFSRHSVACVLSPIPEDPSGYHVPLRWVNDEGPDLAQDPINDLEGARRLWDYIVPRLGVFLHTMMDDWGKDISERAVDLDAAFAEQGYLLSILERMDSSLESLLIDPSLSPQQRQGLEFLKAYAIVAIMYTSGCLDRTESIYDLYAAQFEDLLSRCSALAASSYDPGFSMPSLGFTDDVGILPLLSFIATNCRVHTIRARALELIYAYHRREGFWDGQLLGRGLKVLVDLEMRSCVKNALESGVAIPAEARWSWRGVEFDFDGGYAKVEYHKLLCKEGKRVKVIIPVAM
jgi:hypothetical protein